MQSFEQPARTRVFRLPRQGVVQVEIFPSHTTHPMVVHTPGGKRHRIPAQVWASETSVAKMSWGGFGNYLIVDRYGDVYYESPGFCSELTVKQGPVRLQLLSDTVPRSDCAYVPTELHPMC